jgi:lysophospholipase L1-like esterase
VAKRFHPFSGWAIVLSGMISGILLPAALLLIQRGGFMLLPQVNASTLEAASAKPHPPAAAPLAPLGDRQQLSYQQWVAQLGREANAAAQNPPSRLSILAGDSLSLWFPNELLPRTSTWLNQGISGETSTGLLRRLKLFDQTQPQTIFVMIGINDLIRGVSDETIVANQREIIRHLKKAHPRAQIVMQSILPHGGEPAVQRYLTTVSGDPAPETAARPLWVDRLGAIPNPFIRKLNQRLAIVAREETVHFLDLHPQFADPDGNLQVHYTTDGLHLSAQGYTVWKDALDAQIKQLPRSSAISQPLSQPTSLQPSKK